MSVTTGKQMPVLDAVRGLAIVMVLAHRLNVTPNPGNAITHAICSATELGWAGVQLFFVLSGFLITGILMDTRGRPGYFRTFYARRVLRIFPLYYAVLLVAFVIVPLVTGVEVDGHEGRLWMGLYVSNFAGLFHVNVGTFSHFWSLAVEEQFYLVWPFVVFALDGRKLPIACFVTIAVSLASRIVVVERGIDPEQIYFLTTSRVDALAMGALGAWAFRQPAIVRVIHARERTLVAIAIVLFVAGGVFTHGYPRLGATCQMYGYGILAFVLLLFVVVVVSAEQRKSPIAKLLAARPMRVLGKYSYGIYVFHALIHHWVGMPLMRRLGLTDTNIGVTFLYFTAMTALSFGCALVSYHLLEQRFLRLKDRFPNAS